MRLLMRSRWPFRTGTASWTSSLSDLADGRDDVGVSGAAADIPTHALRDLGVGESWCSCQRCRHVAGPACFVFIQQRNGRADLVGRAVATLQSVMVDEGGLHGMEVVAVGQALDRRDLVAVMHQGEAETAVDPLSIDDNRARAALSLIASLFCPGQREMFA